MIECRRVSRSKAKRDGDFLMKNHQREVAASRMKAEKLKSLLTKLQDGERKSKLRNDNLLGDFGKVSEMASDLERKADKLRNVKRQYETYIDTVYPEWKENIESSRMDAIRRNAEIPDGQSSESPIQPHFEDHVQGEFPREFRDSVERDYQGNVLHSTAKYDGPIRMPKPFKPYKRRPSDRSPRNRFSEMTRNDYESSQNYTKSDSYYAKDTRDLVDDWRNLRMEIGEPNASSSYIRNGGFPQSHHHYSRSNLSGRESGNGVRSETFLQNRSNVLNLPEVDQRTDISGFTILPQALALSPDGRLVLLPMAFSPGMQVHNASHHGVSQTPQHERFADSATGGSVLVDEDQNRPMKADNWNSRSKIELCNGDTTSSTVEPRGSVENVTREPFVNVRESKDLDRRISQTENSRPVYETVKDRNVRKPSKNEDLNLKHISSVNSGDFQFSKSAEMESVPYNENEYHMNNSDNNHNVKSNRTSIVKVADNDDKGEYSVESDTRRAMPHKSAAENIENVKIAKTKNSENVPHGFDNDNVNIKSDLSYKEVSVHSLDRGGIEQNVAPTSLQEAIVKHHSSINAIPIEHEPIVNESRLQLQASVDSFAEEGETTNTDKSLNDFKAFNKSSDHTDGIPYQASDSRITETYPENFRNGVDSVTDNLMGENRETSYNYEKKISVDNVKAYYQAGISGDDLLVNEKETKFVAAEKLIDRRALSFESDETDLNTQPSRPEASKDEKYSCLDINDFSYLLEEIENRMGVAPKTEFYTKIANQPPKQLMEEIKTSVASAGSLEDIETQDLCSLAALDISERIKESGHDCILKNNADVEALSTVEDFRRALNPGFSDLWEYVFNHLELLVGNEIFDSVTAAEKFSRILAPNSSNIQIQIQTALIRTLEGAEEESIPLEVEGNESIIESGAEKHPHGEKETNFEEIEEASVGQGSDENYQKEGLETDLDVKESSVEKAVPQSNKTGLAEQEKEDKKNDNVGDLSLDLGSVSDEDSSSTFDSTQFTARKEGEKQSPDDSHQNKEDEEKTDDVSSIESSEESTEEIPTEKDPPQEEKSNGKADEITNHSSHHDSYDSDDDLDDLLNSSLAQSGSRNTLNIERKKEANGDKQENNQKKQLSVFNSNQNFPGEVTQDQNDNVSENSHRKDVLSPTSAKSISSKFRKPGFWENSDSESEAEELEVSGGHNLSNGNENDDDFDFEFYT